MRRIPLLVFGALALAGQMAVAQNPPQAAPAPAAPPAPQGNQQAPPTWTPDIKFATGRNIVPYFEGWIRNSDQTIDLVFGYYNRNQEQDFVIPAGPDNNVTPGGPDRGQPTYFTAKRQVRIWRLRVPKDFPDKAVTWSLTVNGQTEKVVAKLVPAYEKDERMMLTNNSTGTTFGEDDPNQPPTIQIPKTLNATVGQPLELTATVTDDGLPKPRPVAPPKPAAQLTPEQAKFQSQRNNSGGGRGQQTGTRVAWLEYRGPARVVFETQTAQVKDGKAVTTVKFTAPGTYTLYATATDTKLYTRAETVVTVK